MALSVENRKIFPAPLYFVPPLKGFPLELGIGAGGQKSWNDGATGPTKKFDDILSRLHILYEHEIDGRTDRRTPGHSKDRAYA